MSKEGRPRRVLRAHTSRADPALALAELADELKAADADGVLLFCSAEYDLERLGPAIAETFGDRVAACSSAGQIGAGGFERGGITGVSLAGGDLTMRTAVLSPLSLCQTHAQRIAREHAERKRQRPDLKAFGVLLIDGLSLWEEFVTSALYQALGDVTLVGGSAASDVPERAPAVYHAGHFVRDAAVLALFETTSFSFHGFSTQYFEPSAQKLVITLADPERRTVYEINGEPASEAYAEAIGVDEAGLGPRQFAAHPLMLDLGDQLLPRAIRKRQPDGSLLLGCAIEEGLVLSIAKAGDPVATLSGALDAARTKVGAPEAILTFDCVLRRIDLQARGVDAVVGQILADSGAVGFSGYGEQLGPLHVNHTLTGLLLGAPRRQG